MRLPVSARELQGYALVDSPFGELGLVWGDLGLRRILLPGEGPEAPASVLRGEHGPEAEGELPPPLALLVAALRSHLSGTPTEYDQIPLDLSGLRPFAVRVYEATRRIPWGKARTYGAVAHGAGAPGAARAVGAALARNPFPLVVPCHRVLAADASLRGFSAPGGLATKRRLLSLEGCPAGRR